VNFVRKNSKNAFGAIETGQSCVVVLALIQDREYHAWEWSDTADASFRNRDDPNNRRPQQANRMKLSFFIILFSGLSEHPVLVPLNFRLRAYSTYVYEQNAIPGEG
jgi:hypothetical protein